MTPISSSAEFEDLKFEGDFCICGDVRVERGEAGVACIVTIDGAKYLDMAWDWYYCPKLVAKESLEIEYRGIFAEDFYVDLGSSDLSTARRLVLDGNLHGVSDLLVAAPALEHVHFFSVDQFVRFPANLITSGFVGLFEAICVDVSEVCDSVDLSCESKIVMWDQLYVEDPNECDCGDFTGKGGEKMQTYPSLESYAEQHGRSVWEAMGIDNSWPTGKKV